MAALINAVALLPIGSQIQHSSFPSDLTLVHCFFELLVGRGRYHLQISFRPVPIDVFWLGRISVLDMSNANALIRSACDRCHQKKVRCIMSKHRDVCDRCAEHRTTCVFSPSGRNGRPPRSQPPAEPAPSQAPLVTPPESASSSTDGDNTSGQPKITNDSASSSFLDSISMTREPLTSSLDPTWSFVEDGPFGPLSPVDPSLLGTNSEADHHSVSMTDDAMMQNFFHTPPSFDFTRSSEDSSQILSNGCAISEPPSTSETLRLLHIVQQKLHEECSKQSFLTSTSSSRPLDRRLDLGTFFQLIDEMQDVVHRYFDVLLSAGSKIPCDFSSAMALATTMGNVVEVYEMIARCIVMASNPMSVYGIGRHRGSFSRPSFSRHSSTRHRDDLTNGMEMQGLDAARTNSSMTTQDPEDTLASQVNIGSYIPSEDITRRILADVLLYQMSISQKLLDQLRQHIVQAESASMTTSAFATANMATTSSGISSPASQTTLAFFTPELHLTVVQLLNQLQLRIAKLEPLALEGTKQMIR
ncbi:hypothetical protein K431DRAFT_163063 [Polychaeton citri CBS 116435]|uniref:Zn(2)-C6 fungal-type domain-containing protein n=1 Tax=Polychaeton citri CBS 116435 TaxID=1314669 RepID=A0A9P4PZR2_9PEZI|nr:hypothetical protein K431DRAFT_163063 [Polychaeton citri CBS 116435]